jgi:hypothetical protein
MIVLILVAILWIAVLVPSVISKMRERQSAGSIGRFHERLDLLERTGPKLVEPAYRLAEAEPVPLSYDPIVVAAPPAIRPTLTLVPPLPSDASEALDAAVWAPSVREEIAMTPRHAARESLEAFDDVDVVLSDVEPRALAAVSRRRAARRRRRDVFGALCALTAVHALVGLAPSLRGAWYVSAGFLALLVAFVGLAVYGQRIESERRHLANLRRAEQARLDDEGEFSIVKYLSSDELSAMAGHYEGDDRRLAAEA